VSPNFAFGAGVSIALLWCRVLAAAHVPVVVQLRQDVPEIDEAGLRDAIARELGEPVLLEKDATTPSVTVTVEIRRELGELVVRRQDAAGTLARRVPLPADPAEAMRTAVFLVGNLARDEASELIGELRPTGPPEAARPPDPESPSPVVGTPPSSPALWIGLAAEGDLAFMRGANGVCLVDSTGAPTNNAGYRCVDPTTGTRFPPNPTANAAILPESADQVAGGIRPANVRLLLSVDYALDPNVLLGARVGYVLGTDPSSRAFPPLHLEARFTYLVGHDAVLKEGLSPMIFVGLGAGAFDAYVPVTVNSAPSFASNAGPIIVGKTENAWLTGGPFFVSAGGGARALFGRRIALTAALKFEGALGGSAGFLPGIAPELGVQLGF
jgi:hypothetical protein